VLSLLSFHLLTLQQANSYANLEDIDVVGAVIYKGTDAAGRQLSAVFGGSDAVRKLIEDNRVDVRTRLDQLTTSIKYVMFLLNSWILCRQCS
jgi:hypothetical protein